MPERRVPVYEPALTAADVDAVTAAVKSGAIASGPSIGELESAWSKYCGMPYGIAVSSGTAALELAIEALDLSPGDEVLCPTFTIISCVRAILAAGAMPVLVDAEPRTFNIDLAAAEKKIGKRTRAILVVHTYGYPVDAVGLARLAGKHGLTVIEDAAEAHGAEVLRGADRWLRCGAVGHLSTFSFYANKAITCGEGGMVLARDRAIADRVRAHRNLCFDKVRRFRHDDVGANYRITNMQAALGVAQLSRIEEILETKRHIAHLYRERLGRLPELEMQANEAWARPVPWMVGVVLRDSVPLDAAGLAERLAEAGIDTRPFFLGMHEQPAFAKRRLFLDQRYPVAERLSRRGLYLPSGLDLDLDTIQYVCDEVRAALALSRRRR